MAQGAARIRVTFQIDADGLLTVSAKETTTGEEQQVAVKPSYGLSEEEMAHMLRESLEHGREDMQLRIFTESVPCGTSRTRPGRTAWARSSSTTTACPRTTRWKIIVSGSGGMAIRHSTAPDSPMAFEAAGYNRQSPLLYGALGRVWLAHASDEERRTALKAVGVRQTPALTATLEGVRRDGYAFTRPPRPTRLHGFAVPILSGNRLLGSISMRFPRSAMGEDEVVQRFGKRLAAVARAIAADVVSAKD